MEIFDRLPESFYIQEEALKIVKPSVEILYPHKSEVPRVLTLMERAIRTCYQSQDRIEEGSASRLIAKIRENHHDAMLEFGDMIAVFTIDRGVSHELVRHRIGISFAQESTRYCDYKRKGVRVIEPPGLKGIQKPIWLLANTIPAFSYQLLRRLKVPAQIARSVLPTDLATEIVVKANFREWRNIFELRALNPKAHPQMREVMLELLHLAAMRLPEIFEDLATKGERL
jgi:thymidylate synthase (FAD)